MFGLGLLGRGFGGLGAHKGSAAAPTPGVLAAAKGSFILTGQAANLIATHLALGASAGSFTLSGQTATLAWSGEGSAPDAPTMNFSIATNSQLLAVLDDF